MLSYSQVNRIAAKTTLCHGPGRGLLSQSILSFILKLEDTQTHTLHYTTVCFPSLYFHLSFLLLSPLNIPFHCSHSHEKFPAMSILSSSSPFSFNFHIPELQSLPSFPPLYSSAPTFPLHLEALAFCPLFPYLSFLPTNSTIHKSLYPPLLPHSLFSFPSTLPLLRPCV